MDSLLSCPSSSLLIPYAFPFGTVFIEVCGGNVGGAEEACAKAGVEGKEEVNIGEGVILGVEEL